MFSFSISKAVATVITITCVTTSNALGINCRGSSSCDPFSHELARVANLIQGDGANPGIPDERYYQNGEHIYCVPKPDNYLCAFLQKSGGAPGHSIKTLIGYLVQHGCEECGSVPLFYPNDNNVDNGELTVNVVSDSYGCNGYC